MAALPARGTAERHRVRPVVPGPRRRTEDHRRPDQERHCSAVYDLPCVARRGNANARAEDRAQARAQRGAGHCEAAGGYGRGTRGGTHLPGLRGSHPSIDGGGAPLPSKESAKGREREMDHVQGSGPQGADACGARSCACPRNDHAGVRAGGSNAENTGKHHQPRTA